MTNYLRKWFKSGHKGISHDQLFTKML